MRAPERVTYARPGASALALERCVERLDEIDAHSVVLEHVFGLVKVLNRD